MSDWDVVDERLEAHSAERRTALARRDRRRRVLPWVLSPFLLPGLGAAVLLWLMEDAGGDFGTWPLGRTLAVVAACFVVPALLSGWFARRQGVVEALVWALVCVAAQLALVVGVGFLALGLGPD